MLPFSALWCVERARKIMERRTVTYDQWKTTDPRDYEPEDDELVDELETARVDLRASQAESRKYREALVGLFCVVKALTCPGGLSSETLREYLRTHPAAREAADALRTDRLDDPKF